MRTPVCIQDYVDFISGGTPFAQANYGDGEWACLTGLPGQNCNGEHYSAPLALELVKTILHPPSGYVWYGSNPGKRLETSVQHWLLERGLTQRVWVYKEIISGANVNGKLRPFIEAVRGRKTVLVGPKHLCNGDLHKLWNIKAQVSVPTADAFLAYTRTLNETVDMLDEHKPELMLVCSGMAANPLIHDMFRKYPHITMIDMGATLDPYAGVFSRKGYRKPGFQEHALAKNLEGLRV